jgi:hypothetical protein
MGSNFYESKQQLATNLFQNSAEFTPDKLNVFQQKLRIGELDAARLKDGGGRIKNLTPLTLPYKGREPDLKLYF